MRIFLVILAFIALCSSPASAGTRTEQLQHQCATGSSMPELLVFVTYDSDSGCPLSATGVDCSGESWGITFGARISAGHTFSRTVIESITNNTLNITAQDEVDFRVINLESGRYIGETYHCAGAGQVVAVDLSGFEKSMYAVVSFKDGIATSLSTFVR